MVETISPGVYGTGPRWAGALALHVVGATATAAGFGALVAAAAAMLGAPWGRAGGAIVAAFAVLYLVRELAGTRVPVPQLRRQVPDWWRSYFGRSVAGVLRGRRAGGGLLTLLGHGTVPVGTGGAPVGGPCLPACRGAHRPGSRARGGAPRPDARPARPPARRRRGRVPRDRDLLGWSHPAR